MENFHALCVRECETSEKAKGIQNQVDLIEGRNKTVSKEISSKQLENITLQETLAALKKENSEAMMLVEREKHNYNTLSVKGIATF